MYYNNAVITIILVECCKRRKDHYHLGDKEWLDGEAAFELGLERWKLFDRDKMENEKWH